MMKQVEVLKSREGIKKERTSGADITDDPGTQTGGLLKTKLDENKEEGFEDTTEDTVKQDEVAEVLKKNNSREIIGAGMLNTEYKAGIKVHQGRELIRKPETRDGMLNMYKKAETRAVMVDITDAVRLDSEYEAGIKVHQGREFIMYKKFETRDGMLKTNPKPMIKSFGVAAFKNFLERDSGKHRVHEKPDMRSAMVDIIDAIMLNTEYEAGAKVH
jgi:hypothetical protein